MKFQNFAIAICILFSIAIIALITFSTLVELPFYVDINGRIEPEKILPVALPVSGSIKSIAKPGKIKKGNSLVKLDSELLEKEMTHAQETIAFLTKERKKEMPPLGDYRRRYALTKEIMTLKQNVDTLKKKISLYKVNAPFDGEVLSVNALPTQLAGKEETLLVMGDSSSFVFRCTAGTTAGAELQTGQNVLIRFDAYPYMRYGETKAKIIQIESHIDKGVVPLYTITCQLKDLPEFPIITGLTGTARVIVFRGTFIKYLLRMR
jgi:multidrug resistance efflux pump